jgi:hypothetical protein
VTDELSDNFEAPLTALGQLLKERRLHFEFLAIGGGALQLLGLIVRPTRDIDVVGVVDETGVVPLDRLPAELEHAIADTAAVFHLPATWFNAGPRSLTELGLPDGALRRAHRRVWGGLVRHLADRRDQIFFKLYAAVDQGPRSKHFEDLQRLGATRDELRAAGEWTRTHDPSEAFATELRRALRDLGVTHGDV